MAALPPGWKLPDLRIDVDGDWYDEGIQVTHPGILANLRGNLRKDAEGYFIQTRVRIPVKVDDAPFVVTRLERRGEGLHAGLNDGAEGGGDPAPVRLRRGGGTRPALRVRDDARRGATPYAMHLRLCPDRPPLQPLLLHQGGVRPERDLHEPRRDVNALHGHHA